MSFALANGLQIDLEMNPQSGGFRVIRKAVVAELPADTLTRPIGFIQSTVAAPAAPFLSRKKVGGITFVKAGRANFSFSMSRK